MWCWIKQKFIRNVNKVWIFEVLDFWKIFESDLQTFDVLFIHLISDHLMLHRARCCYGKSSYCDVTTPTCVTRYLNVTDGSVICAMLRYPGHIGCSTSEIISRLVSLGCLLSADTNVMDLLQREHPKNLVRIWVRYGKKWLSVYKSSTVAETVQDRTKVTIEDQWEVR